MVLNDTDINFRKQPTQAYINVRKATQNISVINCCKTVTLCNNKTTCFDSRKSYNWSQIFPANKCDPHPPFPTSSSGVNILSQPPLFSSLQRLSWNQYWTNKPLAFQLPFG